MPLTKPVLTNKSHSMDTDHSPDAKDFIVAVIGGGVCGLALAIALKKGVPFQLFEATVCGLHLRV